MKLALLIFGITGFLMVNTYYDGKYTAYLQSYQKYMKMAMFLIYRIKYLYFYQKTSIRVKRAFYARP